MRREYLSVVMLLSLCVMLSGCIQEGGGNAIKGEESAAYKVISTINYDSSLCESAINYNLSAGVDTGLGIQLRDKNTGERIQRYFLGRPVSGEGYVCSRQGAEKWTVFADSRGYSPVAFEVNISGNKMATIDVPIQKSCTGGPGCFDNVKIGLLELAGGNQTKADELFEENQRIFFDKIKESFGLEKEEYTLDCMECYAGQSGYIKAKGKYKDGSVLEMYFLERMSPSVRGWVMCFSAENNEIFERVKKGYCSQIQSVRIHDNSTCTEEAYNKTAELRSSCLAGEFEKAEGGFRTIALSEWADRCSITVEKGDFDCLGY